MRLGEDLRGEQCGWDNDTASWGGDWGDSWEDVGDGGGRVAVDTWAGGDNWDRRWDDDRRCDGLSGGGWDDGADSGAAGWTVDYGLVSSIPFDPFD